MILAIFVAVSVAISLISISRAPYKFKPETAIVAAGFTSGWDVLYVDDVRIKCVVIGIAFDLVGYLLMTLPYLFFWDYTDEKHREIMKALQERADAMQDASETAAPAVPTQARAEETPLPTG
ncbi:MAG: hypothetical protein IJK89_12065 [Clostridia bacterium]|nr:hypothetical protein [Clostridia bacterium]